MSVTLDIIHLSFPLTETVLLPHSSIIAVAAIFRVTDNVSELVVKLGPAISLSRVVHALPVY